MNDVPLHQTKFTQFTLLSKLYSHRFYQTQAKHGGILERLKPQFSKRKSMPRIQSSVFDWLKLPAMLWGKNAERMCNHHVLVIMEILIHSYGVYNVQINYSLDVTTRFSFSLSCRKCPIV